MEGLENILQGEGVWTCTCLFCSWESQDSYDSYKSWGSRSWLVPRGLKGQNKHQYVCMLGVERRVGYKKADFSTTEEICF